MAELVGRVSHVVARRDQQQTHEEDFAWPCGYALCHSSLSTIRRQAFPSVETIGVDALECLHARLPCGSLPLGSPTRSCGAAASPSFQVQGFAAKFAQSSARSTGSHETKETLGNPPTNGGSSPGSSPGPLASCPASPLPVRRPCHELHDARGDGVRRHRTCNGDMCHLPRAARPRHSHGRVNAAHNVRGRCPMRASVPLDVPHAVGAPQQVPPPLPSAHSACATADARQFMRRPTG